MLLESANEAPGRFQLAVLQVALDAQGNTARLVTAPKRHTQLTQAGKRLIDACAVVLQPKFEVPGVGSKP
ncbi:hypothetical protein D3C72_2445600 [compost metagenome]